jgi:hypothetical protein
LFRYNEVGCLGERSILVCKNHVTWNNERPKRLTTDDAKKIKEEIQTMTKSFTLTTCRNFKLPLVLFFHSHKITRIYQPFGTLATIYTFLLLKHLRNLLGLPVSNGYIQTDDTFYGGLLGFKIVVLVVVVVTVVAVVSSSSKSSSS